MARYNNIGIHSEFIKTILKCDHCNFELDIPKPQNYSEFSILSKFIFGIKLTIDFKCTDLVEYRWLPENKKIKLKRKLKLAFLNNKKFIYLKNPDKTRKPYNNNYDKMLLLKCEYDCEQEFNDYDDNKFNIEIFGSSYMTKGIFFKHCIGELTCGGLGYGQVDIYFIPEYIRLINMYKNENEKARDCFKNEIQKLIEKNDKYDNMPM